MKFIIIALVAFVCFLSAQSVTVCPVTCNTSSSTNVCGKLGTVCRRFSNGCNHKMYNCFNSVSYKTVALSRCSSIAVGSSGTCSATTTSSTTSTSSILNSLNSLYPSNSRYSSSRYPSITPIVIRV